MDFESCLARGSAACLANEFDRAIKEWKEAIGYNPHDPGVHHLLGMAYQRKGGGCYRMAMDCYAEAIRLDKDNAYYHNSLAVVLGELGKYPEALGELDEAIRLSPEENYFYENRGEIHMKRKDYDWAALDYTEVIRLCPEDPIACYRRGDAYRQSGCADRAIADFRKAVDLLPEYDLARDTLHELENAGKVVGD
ncbi:MAG: tetratricopeptide repeat protein [Treponema sp.]|nr:tetratricopeptide repeat protein [Treponema sp.]